jgi:hypothetical protein
VVNKETPLPKDIESLAAIEKGDAKSILDIIGKKRFLADRTRPDIAFTSSFLARFGSQQADVHVKAAMRSVDNYRIMFADRFSIEASHVVRDERCFVCSWW